MKIIIEIIAGVMMIVGGATIGAILICFLDFLIETRR